MNLDQLKKKYDLSQEEKEEVKQLIIKRLTAKISPTDTPTAIIIGGQFASGKTELRRMSEIELNNNAVICNSDYVRDFHPYILELKRVHEDLFQKITLGVAREWNDALCKYCRDNRLNYILETAFATGEKMNNTISEIKQVGYKVIIKLLAVNRRHSLLGTFLRYENMKRIEGYGRKPSVKDHDERYYAIPNTLSCILQTRLFDELYIYRRIERKSNNLNSLSTIKINTPDEVWVYLKERDKSLKGYAEIRYWKKLIKVLNMMITRRSSKKEIYSFFEDLKEP